jgi:hypothetical protein
MRGAIVARLVIVLVLFGCGAKGVTTSDRAELVNECADAAMDAARPSFAAGRAFAASACDRAMTSWWSMGCSKTELSVALKNYGDALGSLTSGAPSLPRCATRPTIHSTTTVAAVRLPDEMLTRGGTSGDVRR